MPYFKKTVFLEVGLNYNNLLRKEILFSEHMKCTSEHREFTL